MTTAVTEVELGDETAEESTLIFQDTAGPSQQQSTPGRSYDLAFKSSWAGTQSPRLSKRHSSQGARD